MSAAPITLQCPSCSQAFLTMQSLAQSAQVCPLCSFTAMLGQFRVLSQPNPSAEMDPSQRRGPRRFAPTTAQPFAPSTAPLTQPTFPAAVQYPDYSAQPPSAMPVTGNLQPTMQWPGLQQTSSGELTFPVETDYTAPLQQAAPELVNWDQPSVPIQQQSAPVTASRMYPSAAASDKTGWPSPTQSFELPIDGHTSRSRQSLWATAILTLFIAGVLFLILKDRFSLTSSEQTSIVSSSAVTSKPGPSSITEHAQSSAMDEQIARALPIGNAVPAPPTTAVSILSPAQANDKAQEILRSLFGSNNLEDRLGFVADPESHRASLEKFFSQMKQPLRLVGLELFPTRVKRLPGGNVAPLFHIITDGTSVGSPLGTLRSTREGEVKLDWELFADSFTGALIDFQKVRQVEPRWFTVGLRKNHGFEESVTVRTSHLAFDIQCSFDGRDRTIALATKTSESGRELDREASWGELYIARVLLGWTPVNDAMRLTILDCAAVSEEEMK